MLTFDEIVDSFAKSDPKKELIVDDNRSLNYKSLINNGSNLANSLEAYSIRVSEPDKLLDAISIAIKNTPSIVGVVTSSRVLSSDAKKGLGFVLKYQALDVWDDMEIEYRKN